jgi:hypothetical protein
LKKTLSLIPFVLVSVIASGPLAQEETSPSAPPVFAVEDLRHDFARLRQILEEEHCCLYEYTGKDEFDRMFGERLALIDRPMRYEEFFRIAAPLAAEAGCMQTALWMPGRFFDLDPANLFSLLVRRVEGRDVYLEKALEVIERSSRSVRKEGYGGGPPHRP